MESSDGLPNSRSSTGKETLIPPVIPYPCFPPRYYSTNLSHVVGGGSNGSIPNPAPTEVGLIRSHHQRCSSESVLPIEDQPSWLEDLLDEPDSPVYKGHRRSASDSSAYLDSSVETFDRRKENMFNNYSTGQPWSSSSHNFVNCRDHTNHAATLNSTQKSFSGQQNWVFESSPNSSVNFSNGLPPTRDGSLTLQTSSGPSTCSGPQETDRPPMMFSTISDRNQDRAGPGVSQNSKNLGTKGDFSQENTSASKADVKYAKQKTAHRSRVRKLQYIAELERNVQVLQAEGSAAFADIGFLDQHNLILSMENRALRQRLDSLSQEQLIKQLQHEMLERELGRLQALFQLQMQQLQQQQQQLQQQQQRKQQNAKNSRAKFRDLDSQFGNLSVNRNEASTSADSTNASARV